MGASLLALGKSKYCCRELNTPQQMKSVAQSNFYFSPVKLIMISYTV